MLTYVITRNSFKEVKNGRCARCMSGLQMLFFRVLLLPKSLVLSKKHCCC